MTQVNKSNVPASHPSMSKTIDNHPGNRHVPLPHPYVTQEQPDADPVSHLPGSILAKGKKPASETFTGNPGAQNARPGKTNAAAKPQPAAKGSADGE